MPVRRRAAQLHRQPAGRRGHTLTRSGYTATGGVRGAIAETAESVFHDQPRRNMAKVEVPQTDLTYCIIGAAMRVHRRTPRGLREKHYQAALTAELVKDGLHVPEDYHVEVFDGEVWLGRLCLDHWVNGCVVVEDKAFSHAMGDAELAQVI